MLNLFTGKTQDSHHNAEKDEWGADTMSEIHIAGRIVLNLWRILRHEVSMITFTHNTARSIKVFKHYSPKQLFVLVWTVKPTFCYIISKPDVFYLFLGAFHLLRTQAYMLSGPTHSLFACNTQWKCIGGLTPPPPPHP